MTEEDTFNALKRMPFKEILNHIHNSIIANGYENFSLRETVEEQGWRFEDYCNAFWEANKNNHQIYNLSRTQFVETSLIQHPAKIR